MSKDCLTNPCGSSDGVGRSDIAQRECDSTLPRGRICDDLASRAALLVAPFFSDRFSLKSRRVGYATKYLFSGFHRCLFNLGSLFLAGIDIRSVSRLAIGRRCLKNL
jgi:hypothetical protein